MYLASRVEHAMATASIFEGLAILHVEFFGTPHGARAGVEEHDSISFYVVRKSSIPIGSGGQKLLVCKRLTVQVTSLVERR